MLRIRLAACLMSCVLLPGCITTRIEHYYKPSGDGSYRIPRFIWIDTCSAAGPQYMTFDLGHGVTVTYRWNGALEGIMYVPTGVRAEFPEGVATVRSESGVEVRGTMTPVERTVWYGSGKSRHDITSMATQTIAHTVPLVGWSEQDVRQSGVVPSGGFVDPKGSSERGASWNAFKFYVHFENAPSDTFTVRLPAAEINGQAVPTKEVHFSYVTKRSWILEPCV